ncbi:MAG: hypothetical protein GY950_00510 [bacterium]|nr:hypothetical protein [bacterium]
MIQKINYFITRVFDVILYPFGFINEFWGILFLSIFMSFFVLVIYKYISSPTGIKNTKDKIKANILAIRLYKDFWKVILASFFKSLFYIFKYFTLNIVPLLVIVPILFPAFVQMDIRYGLRPFQVGEEIVIKAAFSQDPNNLDIQLHENGNFKPKMNPVYINGFRDDDKKEPIKEVNWKVNAVEEGTAAIKITAADRTFEKSLLVGKFRGALCNEKYRESSWWHFIYPSEALFPGAGELEEIHIRYPGRNVSFAGIEMHWLIINLVLVLIIVLAFRKRFGVEF